MTYTCLSPIPLEVIEKTREWLGKDGIRYFMDLKEEFGTLMPVLPPGHKYNSRGSFPDPVHFTMGMSFRNFLRSIGVVDDGHWLDDNWREIIERAIQETINDTSEKTKAE